MSRAQCLVCTHQERGRIELLGVSGASHVVLSKQYSISRHSIDRHLARHVSQERRAQLTCGPIRLQEMLARAAEEGLSLLDYCALMRSTLVQQFMAAAEANDRNGTGIIAGRLIETLRLLATLTGDLQRTTSNITNNTLILSSPLMADLQSMLVERLRPHPEAARAVMEGLEQLSARALNGHAPAPPALPAIEHSAA
jgi:hypothetical protein